MDFHTLSTQADSIEYRHGYSYGRSERIARDTRLMLATFAGLVLLGFGFGWIAHAIWLPVASSAGWGALVIVTLVVVVLWVTRRPAEQVDRNEEIDQIGDQLDQLEDRLGLRQNEYGEVWHEQ